MSHSYCAYLLREARQDAKEAGIKIPSYGGSVLSPEVYAIYLGDNFYTEIGACCTYYARAEAIHDYIEEAKTNSAT